MAEINTEKKFLGQEAVERLVENTKVALDEKQPKGDYARILLNETEPADMTANDLWIEISDL